MALGGASRGKEIVGMAYVVDKISWACARGDLLADVVGVLTYKMTELEKVPVGTLVWSSRPEGLRDRTAGWVVTVEGLRDAH